MQWIAVGLAAGYVPFVMLYLLPHAAGLRTPELSTAGAVVPLAFVPLTFAYAILRYKLWDIGVIVRDAAAYTVTLLLGVAELLARQPGDQPRRAGAARPGAQPPGLRRRPGHRLAHGARQARHRARPRARAVPRRASASGARWRRPGASCCTSATSTGCAPRCSSSSKRGSSSSAPTSSWRRARRCCRCAPSRACPSSSARDVFGSDFWEREALGISGVAFPETSPAPAQRLFLLGYRYAFPLTVRGGRVGMVLTGYRAASTPLNSDDVDLVRSLLNQAALAIENAQLVDQLHRQLEEVVRLQQHNEGIIESSPAGIAVLDREGRVASANLAFAALAGVERRQAIGRPLAELLPVAPLPEPGAGPGRGQLLRRRTGEERHLQVSTALLARGGFEEQRVLVVHDVSERVAMAEALREKDRLAALGMLAAGVAHEVNTPITGISSYAQMLLAETPQSDPRYEVLRKMEKQTFRAARIVNNLLELSRSRKQEAHPVEVAALLGECAELLRERLARRGVRLAFAPPAEELLVLGSDGELHQVFTNLMLNAVDAMADGGAAHPGGRRRRRARARHGLATPARASRRRCATRSSSPSSPPSSAQGGTGLGLSISCQPRGAARRDPARDGRPLGRGQLRRRAAPPAAAPHEHPHRRRRRRPAGRPRRRCCAARASDALGAPGEEALALLEREEVDLVLLDLMLPGMSGIDVLRQIRHRDPEQVVVVITAFSSIEGAIEAMREGAFHYIPKPFKNEEVLLTVRKGLEQRRLRSENRELRAELSQALRLRQHHRQDEADAAGLRPDPPGGAVALATS